MTFFTLNKRLPEKSAVKLLEHHKTYCSYLYPYIVLVCNEDAVVVRLYRTFFLSSFGFLESGCIEKGICNPYPRQTLLLINVSHARGMLNSYNEAKLRAISLYLV
jgi:hypothetical protein